MRVRLAILALALTSCASAQTNDGSPADGTDGSSVPTVAATTADSTIAAAGEAIPEEVTTAPASTAAAPTTTALSDTVPPTLATTTAPPPSDPAASVVDTCAGVDGYLTTPSGRRVLFRAPPGAPPAPLVLVLHGYTGTPTGIERYSEMTDIALSQGVVVAYPEGSPIDQGGFAWSIGAGMFSTQGVDDVAALGEMLDVLIGTGCVDADRIVLTGESNGGGLTLLASCDPRLSARLSAAVMVIPVVDPGVLAACGDDPSALPLTAVTGRQDETVPHDGSRPPLLGPESWWPAVAADINGCSSTGDLTTAAPGIEQAVGGDCRACTTLIVIADGAHTWPGTSQGVAGLHPGSYQLNPAVIDLAQSGGGRCIELEPSVLPTRYAVPVTPAEQAGWGDTHSSYPATDIFLGGCGATVVAPVDGTVLEVRREDRWDPQIDNPATRGGRSVAILGNDGVRYYLAHFESIETWVEPGAVTTAGTPLGAIGTTGRSSACHVHFGISPPCPGPEWSVRRGAIWPAPYLDDWLAGGQRSPVAEIQQFVAANPEACAEAMADPFAPDST